ncbi:MAG: prepilin-type N-terminal cleavage/methylation domain-containing protein [Candidatus Omnitrophica bacterium]|nr:prepilin-type N-terminal cleavage/methylation domain-containing protein [Candidatus Omnitrophota bacterium]
MQKNRGFTLIEVILSIIILGVILTPFSVLVSNVIRQNIYSQAQATAVSLAEGELERITNMRFAAVAAEASAAFAAPFGAYTHAAAVDYVNAGALNTPVAGPTDYKRVQVSVNNTVSGTITLTTLVTNKTNQ